MIIDEDFNVYYMNKWLSVHCNLPFDEKSPLQLLDIFPLKKEQIISLKRHIKTALTLGSPSFFTADSNHYLFAMKHSLTIKSIFEFMQQDITIIPYDSDKRQVSVLVYDQTVLMEEKVKCHKESAALAHAITLANETIAKLENAQRTLIKQKDIIYHQAHFDQLTSLANRTLLQQRLLFLIEESIVNNKKFGVLFLDLDGFKEVNDSLGHDVGDALLVHVGKILLHETRKSDTVGRLGGDEFILLIDDITDHATLATIAKKIIKAISQPLSIKHFTLNITTSIGISYFPEHGNDFNTLIKSADIALYKAKTAGKNTYKIYTPHINPKDKHA